MTEIDFERTGGLLGNNLNLHLDLDKMPQEEAQTLQQLIMDSGFYNIPENLGGSSTPDEFQYVITVRAGQSEHTVRASNTTMPKALSPLVAALSAVRGVEDEQARKKQ